MSQQNVEIVRRVYASATAGRVWPQELFGADFESDMREVGVGVGVLPFDATQEALREYFETFDDFHVEMEELIHADGQRVVNSIRDGGRMRGSEAEISNIYFHVWAFTDGKIVQLSVHSELNRALEAAGLAD
jgi:ketosteroid isomerase-like protein